MEKISVIIPVYNNEKFIQKCMDSVINQSYRNLEIIVINDGSTDSSLAIIRKLAKKDNRILIINQSNSGVSSARNAGLNRASGDYIGFVDSDDYISEVMYEQLISMSIENNANIVECNYHKVTPTGKILSSGNLKSTKIEGSINCLEKYLKQENTTNYNVNKIFRADILKEIRYPEYKYSEDYYFNSKAFMNCQIKITLSNCLYYYVQHSESASKQSFNDDKLDIIKSGEDILDMLQDKFPKMSVYPVLYILNNIRVLYNQLPKESSDRKEVWKNTLTSKFNLYFDKWEKEIYQINISQKAISSYKLFRKSPITHDLLWDVNRLIEIPKKLIKNMR